MQRAPRRRKGRLGIPLEQTGPGDIAANARWRVGSKGLHRSSRSASSIACSQRPAHRADGQCIRITRIVCEGMLRGGARVSCVVSYSAYLGGGARPERGSLKRRRACAAVMTIRTDDYGTALQMIEPQAHVLVMGHVLHDWDLDQKRALIGKAYAALPRGGSLIVYETIIDVIVARTHLAC